MRVNVTSAATIFWKFFFPTFWIVFFTTLTLGLIFAEVSPTSIPKNAFVGLMCVTLLLGITLFYLSIIRLKKVEMDLDYIYVTNYFKWFKYPYHNIERISQKDLVLLKVITFTFKEKGHFGKRIFFLADHRQFDTFLKENPSVTKQLLGVADDD